MNFIQKIISYISESISELKKVTWPTKNQTLNYTLAVLAMSIGMAVFFALLDYIFNLGLAFII
jgi:preprotein translocase subunit SecE